MSVALVLDVDTGIDDALALLHACASPEVELVAVTCVGGNVEARQVATNTLAVLELAGRADVPVWLGAEQPLVKPLETTPETHGPRGIGYAELPPAARALEAGHAADRIVELARFRPGEITLVTLGPLTNLALALEREPALPSLLRGYVLMGGAYRAPGNTTPTTEWNLHVDPDAAKRVLAAWGGSVTGAARPLAMGLDVTEGARLVPAHLGQLALRAGAHERDAEAMASERVRAVGSVAANPILRFIADAVRFYFEFHDRYDGFYGAFIHDPFALDVAIDRSLARAEPVFVDVEAGPGLAHGMTVADWRGLTRKPANLDVAVQADAGAFMERFVDRVGALAAHVASVAG
ncbi:MAG TPA: nucleoside hydrolase [Candidatus Limnocylindria bacterium]|nr:nucleoside hydrolase [Candidatus Limnocylindria bacterium]